MFILRWGLVEPFTYDHQGRGGRVIHFFALYIKVKEMLTLLEIERCHTIYHLWEKSVDDREAIERLIRFLPKNIVIYMDWLIHRWSAIKPSAFAVPTPTRAVTHRQQLEHLHEPFVVLPDASASLGLSPYLPS